VCILTKLVFCTHVKVLHSFDKDTWCEKRFFWMTVCCCIDMCWLFAVWRNVWIIWSQFDVGWRQYWMVKSWSRCEFLWLVNTLCSADYVQVTLFTDIFTINILVRETNYRLTWMAGWLHLELYTPVIPLICTMLGRVLVSELFCVIFLYFNLRFWHFVK